MIQLHEWLNYFGLEYNVPEISRYEKYITPAILIVSFHIISLAQAKDVLPICCF